MALSSFVYLRDVNNLSDARYAAGMGVDLIGFKINPNDPDSLNSSQFKEISEWISGVKKVGEFGDSNSVEVSNLLENFVIDYVLVSDESQIHNFALLGIPLILLINLNDQTANKLASTLNYCSGSVDYFLLESEEIHLNEKHQEIIKTHATQFPILLGFGITPENAATITHELNLSGISLTGQSGATSGYMDFDKMAEILETMQLD